MTQTYAFSPITANDWAGLVWVAAILSLMFSVITLATRFQIKLHSLGNDDWFIAAGTLIAVGQYVAIFIGLHGGVGRSTTLLSRENATGLGETVMACEILFIIALMLSKLSVVFFMKRLFTRDTRLAWWACNGALGLTVLWGLGSCFAVSIGCSPLQFLYGSQRCVGKLLRWQIVISLDAALEVLYVALSIVLVWPLQMSRYIKIVVVSAFSFRLAGVIFAAFHGVYMEDYIRAADPGLAIANVLVWQQVELGYALIGSTIPTLKSFVRGYNKAMGWEAAYEKRGLGGGYNLGSYVRSGGRSQGISKIGSGGGSKIRRQADDAVGLRPEQGQYNVGVSHGSFSGNKAVRRLSDAPSGDSEEPIIRRDVLVTITHE